MNDVSRSNVEHRRDSWDRGSALGRASELQRYHPGRTTINRTGARCVAIAVGVGKIAKTRRYVTHRLPPDDSLQDGSFYCNERGESDDLFELILASLLVDVHSRNINLSIHQPSSMDLSC